MYADQPMHYKNTMAYNLAVAMELTILECEEMGLEIDRIEFDGTMLPKIWVNNGKITHQLILNGKVQHCSTINKHGIRYYVMQMVINHCKVIWETDRFY